jgi:hypothetical protein
MKQILNILTTVGLIFFGSCRSDKYNEPENPYDNPDNDRYNGVFDTIKSPDPNTIAGLHKYIFKPTCANSGCHDGNFEPDFRTIESSYNTLVNQAIIKNDILNPLTARVTPDNEATSMLIRRLTIDLNANSGIMPLITEPGSDWPTKKEEYIQNIKTWINNGARDIKGNAPPAVDFPPQLHGMLAYDGANLLPHQGFSPVYVSSSVSNLDLYFAFLDDKTPNTSIGTLKVNFSLLANTFDPANEIAIQLAGSPKNEKGFYKEFVDFYHKVTINPNTYGKPGDVIWIRTKISDGVNPVIELPSDNSLFNAKSYYTIKIMP